MLRKGAGRLHSKLWALGSLRGRVAEERLFLALLHKLLYYLKVIQ